jgi:hypothetical protein
MPDLAGLTERQITYLACALDASLFAARRDEGAASEELRQLTARIALAVPSAAVKLPSLLDAAGPQTAAAVKAEARRTAARRLDPDGAGPASSVTAALSASEAARQAGVSSQAIRAAAAAGRLAARKNRITGAWAITASALDDWLEGRSAA